MSSNDTGPLNRDSDNIEPTRDARGRWLKGHCPNPKGRPRKVPRKRGDLADLQRFGNTLVEVRTQDGMELMTRRAALLHKMFEDAMRGKVSMQRLLLKEFEQSDRLHAATRLRYDQLITEWIVNKPEHEELDIENIPFEVRTEIASLESVLNHYYPTQYPIHVWFPDGDRFD